MPRVVVRRRLRSRHRLQRSAAAPVAVQRHRTVRNQVVPLQGRSALTLVLVAGLGRSGAKPALVAAGLGPSGAKPVRVPARLVPKPAIPQRRLARLRRAGRRVARRPPGLRLRVPRAE
jgi:hypothetical protein